MKKLTVLTLAFLLSSQTAFAQNQLANGTFDADVSGWMPDPDHPGLPQWDPTLGLPPGALSITGEYGTILTEECYPAGDGDYIFHADAYMKTNGDNLFCSIEWALYDTEDCSDPYSIILSPHYGSWVLEQNQWESLDWDRIGLVNLSGTKAVRPYLSKAIDENGDDACVFDNVYLEINLDPPPIPAVQPVGLVLLVVLTGLAGFVVLRRRSGA